MKNSFLLFSFALFFLGSLGMIYSLTHQVQDLRGRAAENKISGQAVENKQKNPNETVYSSIKFGYTINYNKYYWFEKGIASGGTDLKHLNFILNKQMGMANIELEAYDQNEYAFALSTQAAGKDDLEKIALYVSNEIVKSDNSVKIVKVEKLKKAGEDVYRLSVDREIKKIKVQYFIYVCLSSNKEYYVITAKYTSDGKSANLAEGFVDSFIEQNSRSSVQGVSDSQNTLLDETKIAELVSPSVVNIAHVYCATIKVNDIPPAFTISNSNKPIQYLKPSYNFCVTGKGSGFLLTKEGHVATNGHVVKYYPIELVKNTVFSNASNVLSQFAIDLYKQEYLRDVGSEVEDEWAKESILTDNYPDEKIFLSHVLDSYIEGELITVSELSSKYYVKLGNEPLTVYGDIGSNSETMYISETQDIREASLVGYNFPEVEQVKSKKIESIYGPDVAILKVKNNKGLTFPSLNMDDIEKLKVGNSLLIFGYPGIVEGNSDPSSLFSSKSSAVPTLTKGIVSAIKEDQAGRKLIQTDASAELGNSGGPAIDLYGNVVGLITYANPSSSGQYNIVRGTGELKELMKKNKIQQTVSPTFSDWYQGLKSFWNRDYIYSLNYFTNVKKSYPIHPTVDSHIADAQNAILAGQNKDPSILDGIQYQSTSILPILSTIFMIIGGFASFYSLIKTISHNYTKLHLPHRKH